MGREVHLSFVGPLTRTLAEAPARLWAAVQLAAAERTPPGEWTAQQVVLHLVAVEEQVFQARLLDLTRSGEPHWSWVEPGPVEPALGETIEGSLERFATARAATLRTVASLNEAGWERAGLHATLGRLDVAGLLALAGDHDEEHIAGLLARGRSPDMQWVSQEPPSQRTKLLVMMIVMIAIATVILGILVLLWQLLGATYGS